MTRDMTRLMRRTLGVGVTGALAVTALIVPVPAARAAGITAGEQEYYSYYSLDSIHNAGYRGAGVTIGLIDGPINTNIPELNGANIHNMSRCTVNSTDNHWDHGSVIAQVLVSPAFGVAPDAALYSYTLSFKGEDTEADCAIGDWTRGKSDAALLIEYALNDGVDVISISSSYPGDYDVMRWALARAIVRQVPVVVSMGNEATYDYPDTLARMSGVIGVSAIETNGSMSDYSNYGNYVSTAALGRPYARRGVTSELWNWWGTSFASPTVAGSLALAKQRWPNATGNQIMQGLTHTGVGSDGNSWNPFTGYGALNTYALMTTSPMSYPDQNPFMNKGYNSTPTRQDVLDYADGVADPSQIYADGDYEYRGFDESIAFSGRHSYPTHLGTSPRYHRK